MIKLRIWLGIGLGCLIACSGEVRENPPVKGEYFIMANPWKFYFVDEAGQSAVKLKPGMVLPTTETDADSAAHFRPAIVPDDYENEEYYLYNANYNSLVYDTESELYYWTTVIPGNRYVTESEFYVHFNRTDVDTVRVKFKFIYEDVDGGDFAVDVRELYYNGTLAVKNGKYAEGEGIYIKK